MGPGGRVRHIRTVILGTQKSPGADGRSEVQKGMSKGTMNYIKPENWLARLKRGMQARIFSILSLLSMRMIILYGTYYI